MGKSIAVEGDVQAVPAAGFTLSGTIVLTTDPKLTVGGKKVVLAATAAFSGPNGATDSASLSGSGKLQKASGGVLLNGDSAQGSQGNQLKVVATGKLQVG